MACKAGAFFVVVAAVLLTAGAGGSAQRIDYAAIALNVLPPGQSGDLRFPPTTSDQLPLYDGLTPRASVTARDLTRYFKSERFGVTGKVVRVERPRAGLRILRDRWDVPHVYGRTRADVEFGAGYATAEDRYVFMEQLRGPGRIAAMDVPGVNPFALATSGRQFVPTEATEQRLDDQVNLIRDAGSKGRQLIADTTAYVAGINEYYRRKNIGLRPWTVTDVIAVGSLLGANLGVGGGDETRRSMFLDALNKRFGDERGTAIWRDLAEQLDPTTPVSVDGTFEYDKEQAPGPMNVAIDDGSFEPWGTPHVLGYHFANPIAASNALLVSARMSATRHPLFVAGPQVGYYFPEILLELDLHGGGIDARGTSFPGLSMYVLLGRGKDFAWSATSANSDIVDHFVETLCGDDAHYVFNGECRAMTTFDAGVLKGNGTEPDRKLEFRETVHGPVIGYARVGGRRVAISSKRSTRGRELLSALAFQDLNTNRVHDVQSFYRAMNQLEFSFNWFYADDKNIAMFSSGRLPVRAAGVASGLPTDGTGAREWSGFEPLARHVRGTAPSGGVILNWNNKPGRGFSSSDDNWTYGPIQRVLLLQRAVAKRRVHTLATLVGAMNTAATQDLRAVEIVPPLASMLGSAPNELDAQLLKLLVAWNARGGSRLDRDLDGKIDDPGAAILDAAWPRIADAAIRPTLGPLTSRLEQLMPVDDPANAGGSSYFGGWYSYVTKDLSGGFPLVGRLCGGSAEACRAVFWTALDEAGRELAKEQGPDPTQWRADATHERISFGFLPKTARWTNRPTFQQAITFDSHRPR
jgi:acyl-homoserine lactone acylase PvdQ